MLPVLKPVSWNHTMPDVTQLVTREAKAPSVALHKVEERS
jgi:hypothetical protein